MLYINIKEAINSYLQRIEFIEFAILFGSAARGKVRNLSDIDVAKYNLDNPKTYGECIELLQSKTKN